MESKSNVNWEEHKKELATIVELIEDKEFPARKVIVDYVIAICGHPEGMDEFIENEFKKYKS